MVKKFYLTLSIVCLLVFSLGIATVAMMAKADSYTLKSPDKQVSVVRNSWSYKDDYIYSDDIVIDSGSGKSDLIVEGKESSTLNQGSNYDHKVFKNYFSTFFTRPSYGHLIQTTAYVSSVRKTASGNELINQPMHYDDELSGNTEISVSATGSMITSTHDVKYYGYYAGNTSYSKWYLCFLRTVNA